MKITHESVEITSLELSISNSFYSVAYITSYQIRTGHETHNTGNRCHEILAGVCSLLYRHRSCSPSSGCFSGIIVGFCASSRCIIDSVYSACSKWPLHERANCAIRQETCRSHAIKRRGRGHRGSEGNGVSILWNIRDV